MELFGQTARIMEKWGDGRGALGLCLCVCWDCVCWSGRRVKKTSRTDEQSANEVRWTRLARVRQLRVGFFLPKACSLFSCSLSSGLFIGFGRAEAKAKLFCYPTNQTNPNQTQPAPQATPSKAVLVWEGSSPTKAPLGLPHLTAS